jgi:hypothetical protein
VVSVLVIGLGVLLSPLRRLRCKAKVREESTKRDDDKHSDNR